MSDDKQNKHGVKTVGTVMIIMMLVKMAGLVRLILHAGRFGTSGAEAEAFSVASQIPAQFLDIFFAAAFTASFIPIFNIRREKDGKDEAFKLSGNFLTIIILLTTVLTAVLTVLADGVIGFMGPGLDVGTKQLAAGLLRVMLPAIILSGTAFSLTGILQSMNEFNIPAAMSLVSNLLIIAYYLFFIDRFGVFGLAVVYLIGWVTQVLVQVPALRKMGFRYRPFIDIKDQGIRDIGRLMPFVMISAWAAPINILINTGAATHIPGGAPALKYATELYTVITGVFVYSVTNVMFTRFSRLLAGGRNNELKEVMSSTVRGMMFFLLPMSAGVAVLAPDIVRLAYQRGTFDAESTVMTAAALRFYAFGMAGFGLQSILSRGFYAAKEGKTPLITSLTAIGINAALSFALINFMGTGGPALASGVSVTAVGLLMAVVLVKRGMLDVSARFVRDLCKMLVCAALMAGVVYLARGFIGGLAGEGRLLFRVIIIAVPVCLGVVFYITLAWVCRIGEVDVMKSFLKILISKLKAGGKRV